jgi:hypothetical protein
MNINITDPSVPGPTTSAHSTHARDDDDDNDDHATEPFPEAETQQFIPRTIVAIVAFIDRTVFLVASEG